MSKIESNKFSRGKVYKIVSNQTDKIYVGSSTQPRLCNRLAQHRASYKRYLKGKGSKITSFEIVKFEDCQIILIEEVPCTTKDQLLAKERYYIELLDCVNKIIPTRSVKEYHKIYYSHNKESVAVKKKQKHICVCGGKYSHVNKAQHLKTFKHRKRMMKKEIEELKFKSKQLSDNFEIDIAMFDILAEQIDQLI